MPTDREWTFIPTARTDFSRINVPGMYVNRHLKSGKADFVAMTPEQMVNLARELLNTAHNCRGRHTEPEAGDERWGIEDALAEEQHDD